MENLEKTSVDEPTDKIQDIAKKLEEKTKEKLNPTEIKEMFNELGKDSKADNDLADIFYKSVKMIFDMGFDLANKLANDLVNNPVSLDSLTKNIEKRK